MGNIIGMLAGELMSGSSVKQVAKAAGVNEKQAENLMGNAIRYGRRGGHVKILLRQRCIIVEDDGIGIEKKHLPYLFEQFYRVDQSRDPEVRGTGLGLSIVRTLAERNGATVGVESCPGRGSRFTVCFEQKQDGD